MSVTLPQTSLERWLPLAIKILAVGIAFLLLLPYALTPLYRVVDPVSTLMLWRWAKRARVERMVTPIDHMPPILPPSVIAAEDQRFCSHHAVDFDELQREGQGQAERGRLPREGP